MIIRGEGSKYLRHHKTYPTRDQKMKICQASKNNVYIYIYTWKAIYPFLYQTPLAIFLVVTASSGTACVRVAAASYGHFSTECHKRTILLRAGLCESCYGFLQLKLDFTQKKLIITAFSDNDFFVLAFQVYIYAKVGSSLGLFSL